MATYKDDKPSNTLTRIKTILDRNDITVNCTKYSKGNLCFSSRIEISNPLIADLHIGTNGKGISEEYSLASGYAEFMERIQNKMLLFEALKYGEIAEGPSFDFRFFPDEKFKIVSRIHFLEIVDKIFPNFKFRRFSEVLPTEIKLLTVPFLNVRSNSIVDVPIEIARANYTTGMCAGNTPAEAMVQGINEILERYVLQVLYTDHVTPPTIPESLFEGSDILNRLRELKKEGFSFIIKDCSLGKGYPVIGLILLNKNTHSWTFRLGADSDSVVALERCFTEIFQGKKPTEYVFVKYEYSPDMNSRYEYAKSLRNGTGKPPYSLLEEFPTYRLRPELSKRTGSQADELKRLISLITKSGHDMLFRDNSFMGFPTYQIIIPGLSDQYCELTDIAANYVYLINNPDRIYPLYHIKSLSQDERNILYSTIINKDYPYDIVHLFPYCLSKKSYMSKPLLLFMLASSAQKYSIALEHLTEYVAFRNTHGVSQDKYLMCLANYIDMKSKGATETQIKTHLMHFYDESDLMNILQGFSDTTKIFDNYEVPDCFKCHDCSLKNECIYQDVLHFEEKIQKIQKSVNINQHKIFENVI